jgi:glycosyltransferase A (GT-A) superfamily protein (DUF2064 family)/glycosyltransferase involved in cell wall biosynthesis
MGPAAERWGAVIPNIAAVVPVIDEREAIGDVVAGLRNAGACCVLVVDGGSRDGTREVAIAAGGQVVDEPRRGYGRACLTGAQRALDPGPDGHAHEVIAFLDGDGSCDPADLPALVAALADADLAIGRRPARLIEAGAMPWHARFGNRLVAAIVSMRSGRAAHDLPPFKVLRRAILERLDLDDEAYGWTVQVLARALAEPSTRVREVPVGFRRRRGGVSKVSGSWKASIRAGRAMVGVAVRETRSRPVIALMAKAPGAGHAKTRLASELGEGPTADLWAACLADVAETLHTASRNEGSCPMVMLARQDDLDPVVRIIGPGWTPIVQLRPGLSAALADVFMAAFDRGADRAVAVAGDAPGLPPSRIGAALDALDVGRGSAVVGPSSDGGYHLVGLRWRSPPGWWPRWLRMRLRSQLARRLESGFGGVPMGGSSALDATRRTLNDAGWRVSTTAPWPDVDTLADLRALIDQIGDDGRWAPRTVAWVASHRNVIDQPLASQELHPQEERS